MGLMQERHFWNTVLNSATYYPQFYFRNSERVQTPGDRIERKKDIIDAA